MCPRPTYQEISKIVQPEDKNMFEFIAFGLLIVFVIVASIKWLLWNI